MAAIRLPTLRREQYEIAMDEHPIRVCCAGRRFGKSVLGSCLTVNYAQAGFPVAWIAPLFKNTRPIWKAAKAAVKELKAVGQVRVSEADRVIEFLSTGGVLEIHSAESAASLYGSAYRLVVVDEAGLIADDVINEIIFPTISDFMDGQIFLIGSPKGMESLFFDWWQRGQDGDPNIRSWQYPTSMNPSPAIQKSIEKARAIMPDVKFRQEMLAEWIPGGTGVFVNVDDCAIATPQTKAIEGRTYVQGIDFGRKDFTVICTYDIGEKSIVDMVRINEIDYTRQRPFIIDAYNRFMPTSILAEKNSIGDPIISELKALGLPVQGFQTTSTTKNTLVDNFSLALQNHAIKLIKNPVLLNELKAYTGRMLPSGLWQYGRPGRNDDCVIAAMLAYHAGNVPERITRIYANNPFYD